ncbi:NusG domain II-containing protein [Clostridium tarantellae]|uniref:NusG domain II-containing protein n=1 Tax=Clostridium tarantellae TaxID=39493 RepID=A0A6I1MRU3_9CLOT|nr:NusG domain II-containing protein [Clostridium tarantellae]
MFKKADIIIIIILIFISFIPQIVFNIINKDYDRIFAIITIDGNVNKKILLSEHIGKDEFVIESEYGINKILLKENEIAILQASCQDSVCINQGYISKPGENIICLPNKLMIEIRGNKEEEDIILSY